MQDQEIIIREAEFSDVFALSELMKELGYETTHEEMEARFERIYNHADYKTLVAVVGSQTAGMIGLTRNYFYEQNGIYVRIAALIVKVEFRQKGAGKKLMEAAEHWAIEIGAHTLLLNSGNRAERAAAHAFYLKIGFQIKSSGFLKKL